MDGWKFHPSIHTLELLFGAIKPERIQIVHCIHTKMNQLSFIHFWTDRRRQSRGAVESKQRVDPIFLLFWGNLYLLAAAAEPISGFVRNTFGHHKSLPPILELDITPKGELLEDKFVSFPPLCRLGSQIASHLFDFNPAGQWNSLVQFFNRFFPS